MQNFWSNVNNLIWNPTIGRITLIMYGTDTVPPAKLTYCHGTENRTRCAETNCNAIGIISSMDVVVSLLHILFGIDASGYLPVSAQLADSIYVFSVCPHVSTAYELGGASGGFKRAECALATSMARCSFFHSVWLIPWTMILITIVTGLILTCTCCIAGIK
jgi:hypothetical protein